MATYKHLRSGTANKRPTTSIADGQLAINTNTASPGLFFKDSAGTGIVKVGPVHVGTTAPNSSPAVGGSTGNYLGEQWLDTSVSPAQMKVWNGSTWVGVVADELPVSKLQDGAARQLIQTDAAGTGVEWTSNVDVPGTLDVTSTATFDSIAQHPLGTAAAPTITFTGDINTGIYSPGADQVAISTGGVQRIYIDSAGAARIGSAGTLAASDRFLIYESNATRSTVASIENPTLGDGFAAIYDVTANTAGGSERRAYLAVQKQAGQTNPCAVLYMGTQDGANNYHWIDDNDNLRIGTNAQVGTTGGSRYAKDYEEGTWTPTVVGTTTAGTATYSTRVGTYTKVGNMVTIFLEVTWSSGTGTGNLRVTGLPFVSNNNYVTALGASSNLTYTSGQTPYAFTSSSSNINIGVSATGVGAASLAYDAAAALFLTLTYFV